MWRRSTYDAVQVVIRIDQVDALGRVPREPLRARQTHALCIRVVERDVAKIEACGVPELVLSCLVVHGCRKPGSWDITRETSCRVLW